MWTTARASVFALATLAVLALAGEGIAVAPAHAQELVVTDAHIARLKNVLKLTPAQEVHWRAVEAALRDVVRRPPTDEITGIVQRVRARIGTYVLNATAARRVASAAQPLIASLDDQQKQDGMTAVREMGVASLF